MMGEIVARYSGRINFAKEVSIEHTKKITAMKHSHTKQILLEEKNA